MKTLHNLFLKVLSWKDEYLSVEIVCHNAFLD